MWQNFLHPRVNREPWTESENSKLKELALASPNRDWDLIAEELCTGRTAFQCFHRFDLRLFLHLVGKNRMMQGDGEVCAPLDGGTRGGTSPKLSSPS